MKEITVKVPDGFAEQEVMEWVGVLVERWHNAQVNNIPEIQAAVKAAQTGIDSFRTANSLQPKFEAVKEEKKVVDAEVVGA